MSMNRYYEEDEYSSSDYEDDDGGDTITCKNLDPELAKLIGIIVEEQKNIDWTPPAKSGLENSTPIYVSYESCNSMYFKPIRAESTQRREDDHFTIIKRDILDYKTLSNEQLEYIKNLNNENKFELIQIYNKLIGVTAQYFAERP